MRKLAAIISVLFLVVGFGGTASAALTNGGFDTGNFTGWSVYIGDGNVTAITSATPYGGHPYSPVDPSYFAEIEMYGTTLGGFDYIRQNVFLNAGDTLSGSAAYVSYADDVTARVRILSGASSTVVVLATPWSDSGYPVDSGWQSWSWTAQNSGFYVVSLELLCTPIGADVYAFFDANAVSAAGPSVPIPGSLFLLGSGLLGLGGAGWLRRGRS